MCTRPIKIKSRDNKNEYYIVPCGHCEECQARRTSDELVRAYHETLECMSKGGIALFITNTYDKENLPYIQLTPELETFMNGLDRPRGAVKWCENCIKEGKLSCWDLDHIRKYIDNIQSTIRYGKFWWREYNDRGEEIYKELVNLEKVKIKYIVDCERGSGRIYEDEWGNTRKATNRPHYHIISWIEPEEGEEPITDQYEKYFKLFATKWDKGIVYDELIDRDHARATEYCVKYIGKTKNDYVNMFVDQYTKYMHKDHTEGNVKVKEWQGKKAFSTHSTNLGISMLEHEGITQLIEEGKWNEAYTKIAKGCTMPSTKKGKTYEVPTPRYYIKKLTEIQHKWSRTKEPEWQYKAYEHNVDYLKREAIRNLDEEWEILREWEFIQATGCSIAPWKEDIIYKTVREQNNFGQVYTSRRKKDRENKQTEDIIATIYSDKIRPWENQVKVRELYEKYFTRDTMEFIVRNRYINEEYPENLESIEDIPKEILKAYDTIVEEVTTANALKRRQDRQKKEEEFREKMQKIAVNKPGLFRTRPLMRTYKNRAI